MLAEGGGDRRGAVLLSRARHRLLEQGPYDAAVIVPTNESPALHELRAPAPGALDASRAERRGGEDARRRRAPLERARDRPGRLDRGLRRRIDDRCRRVRRRDLPARRSLGCRADDARRAWSTPRSAARPGSTPRRARTSSAPSTSRSRSSSIRASSRRCRDEERQAGMAEVVKTGLLAGERALGAPGGGDDPRLRRVQGRGLSSPTRTSARDGARSSTSGTRSRTRSRRAPTTRCGTATRSRSACSQRSASPAGRPTSSRRCSRPSPSVSTASAPGMRSSATRRARSTSCCSATTGGYVTRRARGRRAARARRADRRLGCRRCEWTS